MLNAYQSVQFKEVFKSTVQEKMSQKHLLLVLFFVCLSFAEEESLIHTFIYEDGKVEVALLNPGEATSFGVQLLRLYNEEFDLELTQPLQRRTYSKTCGQMLVELPLPNLRINDTVIFQYTIMKENFKVMKLKSGKLTYHIKNFDVKVWKTCFMAKILGMSSHLKKQYHRNTDEVAQDYRKVQDIPDYAEIDDVDGAYYEIVHQVKKLRNDLEYMTEHMELLYGEDRMNKEFLNKTLDQKRQKYLQYIHLLGDLETTMYNLDGAVKGLTKTLIVNEQKLVDLVFSRNDTEITDSYFSLMNS